MRFYKLFLTLSLMLSLMSGVAAAEEITCGGIGNIPCADKTMVCDRTPGQCNVADSSGTCKKRPEVCTASSENSKEFLPVCGCDGKTYGSDCARLNAGAQKDHDGKCAAAPAP